VAKASPITTPAHKYGPTADYGSCEVESCSSAARSTCDDCEGHFCLGHAPHEIHDRGQAAESGR
jgi:predicted nucleic acid binding AN1-type Zn finger protein